MAGPESWPVALEVSLHFQNPNSDHEALSRQSDRRKELSTNIKLLRHLRTSILKSMNKLLSTTLEKRDACCRASRRLVFKKLPGSEIFPKTETKDLTLSWAMCSMDCTMCEAKFSSHAQLMDSLALTLQENLEPLNLEGLDPPEPGPGKFDEQDMDWLAAQIILALQSWISGIPPDPPDPSNTREQSDFCSSITAVQRLSPLRLMSRRQEITLSAT